MGKMINVLTFPLRLLTYRVRSYLEVMGQMADEALTDLDQNGPPWENK